VAEQPVFWLGGKPGNKNKERQPPEAERYEPALRDACTACGYEVEEYVAAQGGFGGWLALLEHAGTQYRLFWSGKTRELKLETFQEPGGWQPVRSAETPDEGMPGFVTAVRAMLQPEAADDTG